VEGSRCVENKEDGISVDSRDAGETAILVNTCDKNGNAGVHAYGGSTVRIENNTCRGNAESGVQTDTGSTGTVTGNTCAGGRHGVAIRSAGTVVTAEKNHCSESFEAAIAVYFGAKATVTGNTCSKNKGEGIRVTHWETSADVLNNICSDNDRNGIIVDMGGHAAVRGNECSGNKHYGILVSDEESGADVGENITKDNAKGDRDTVAGLPARLEYQVREYEIGAALMNGQTAYLDRIASRLRKYRSRYDDSGWQLYFFYNGLKYGFATFNENTKPAFGAALEKWASDFPDSCTPRIALAMTEMDYAWSCRGTNWASEVTPEGRKGFREHGDVAEKWCKEAEAKPDKDAYLYSTMIWMAKDRGGSKAHIRALLDKGMAIDPECLALYTTTCQSLWPRWGGSKEEIRELFSMVHERTKDKMGEKMYALLIDSQFAPGAVYGDLGDWKLCKAGMEQILEEFPYSGFILNRYCVLACVFDDKEKARELLGKIGENPDYRFWGPNKDNFANAKRWALSDGPRPDLYHVPGGPSGNLDDHEHNHGVHRSPVVSGIAGLTPRQLGFGLLAAGLAMFLVTVLVIFLIVRLTKKRN
jgi:parallel beta-helix repeat protein